MNVPEIHRELPTYAELGAKPSACWIAAAHVAHKEITEVH